MTLKATMRSLDEVAARLPFHVDDLDRANEAFLRWHASNDAHDLEVVELWAYCYTRRYFIAKFLRDSAYGATELDDLVAKAFTKVRDNLRRVRQPERFASWVSVICRNVFVTFLRRYRDHATFNEAHMAATAPAERSENDRHVARRAVERAVERLPPSLREVARMKFLEDLSYDEISQATDRPSASLRAFAHKAVARLREDPALVALRQELNT